MAESERDALMLLGYVLFAVGRHDRAEKVVRGLLSLFPADVEGERLLAAIDAKLGNHAEVLSITSRQLDLSQPGAEQAVLHWLRAEALWSLDRREEAAVHTASFLKWRETVRAEETAVE